MTVAAYSSESDVALNDVSLRGSPPENGDEFRAGYDAALAGEERPKGGGDRVYGYCYAMDDLAVEKVQRFFPEEV